MGVVKWQQSGSHTRLAGTFHATCVKYLRKHGMKIGLSNNFAIADQDDW